MLAVLWVGYRSKLRADFQQYYNLNIDLIGSELSLEAACDLAAELPRTARVWAALNPENVWDTKDWFLSRIEHNLRVLIWQNSKYGTDPKHYPEQILPIKKKKPQKQSMTSDQLMEFLNRERIDAR